MRQVMLAGAKAVISSQLPNCFNCLHSFGEPTQMDQIGEHIFHCPKCNATKELVMYPLIRRRHLGMWLLSGKAVVASLAIGSAMYSAIAPALARLPAPEIAGGVIFTAYVYVSLRLSLGAGKAIGR